MLKINSHLLKCGNYVGIHFLNRNLELKHTNIFLSKANLAFFQQQHIHYETQKISNVKSKNFLYFSGIDQPAPKWKRCISGVGFNSYSKSNFIYAVSSMYAKRIFDSKAKKEVVGMTKYLRKAFSKLLDELTWMDDETKVEARKKLENMRQFIGYPDEFLDQEKVDAIYDKIEMVENDYLGNVLKLSKYFTKYYALQLREAVDPDDWREHRYVALVNAFYNPSLNNFEFPAGILQGKNKNF